MKFNFMIPSSPHLDLIIRTRLVPCDTSEQHQVTRYIAIDHDLGHIQFESETAITYGQATMLTTYTRTTFFDSIAYLARYHLRHFPLA